MREQVIQALAEMMQVIPLVRQVLVADDVDRIAMTGLPAVMVVDRGGETREPRTGGVADVHIEIELIGLVAAAGDAETQINKLDREIKASIAADRTLGGLVAHVMILDRTDEDITGNETLARFTRRVRVYYVANELQGD